MGIILVLLVAIIIAAVIGGSNAADPPLVIYIPIEQPKSEKNGCLSVFVFGAIVFVLLILLLSAIR